MQVKFRHRGSPGVAGDIFGVTWGTGTSLGSPGDGDIPGVTWGGGRILPLLQGKSHSLGHFLKKTPTRESVGAPKNPHRTGMTPKSHLRSPRGQDRDWGHLGVSPRVGVPPLGWGWGICVFFV